MENEIAYMRKHPPRCLGGKSKPAAGEVRDAVQDQVGEDSTMFSPVCQCSAEVFTLTTADPGVTTIACPACGKSRVIFDTAQYGYDGELGHYAGIKPEQPEKIACTKCGNETFQVAMGFQYSGETDVLDDDDPPDVKPEDLFGWLEIAARCESCGAMEMMGFECA